MTAQAKLPENAIETIGLRKIYAPRGAMPAKVALDGIDLAVPRGGIFGLLGPNGAGKSTLINILAGLVNKTAGTARIWDIDIDRDPRASRAAIGIVPQELNIDPFFTPRELLDLQAGLYGVPKPERRTMEILAAVGLADKADAYARTLSGGMRRRLLVAKALVHAPPVLVLDEPTAGVDIELRQSLWAYVRELNQGGTTVVLTTHYLQEAEELCDRIAIIDRGRLVAHDTKQALLARLDAKELRIVVDCDLGELPARLAAMGVTRLDARTLQLRYRPSAARVEELLAAVHGSGLGIVDLSTRESDLEDLFLQLVRKASDAA
ncbi:MAG: ABC transporter ATP-binding protein [Telmatospirillum sp.]|nr:ABC transporter ATP-binding protein [Telmatospirillum sp.]